MFLSEEDLEKANKSIAKVSENVKKLYDDMEANHQDFMELLNLLGRIMTYLDDNVTPLVGEEDEEYRKLMVDIELTLCLM